MALLSVGEKMPNFKLKDQNGDWITPAELKGKKLALYFYPEDDTPTCTVQACNLRDNFAILTAQGITVIGVSPNTVEDHKRFEEKFTLPFTLLADPQHVLIDKFGVWGLKNLYGREYMGLKRTTFLINEKGIIFKVFARPKNAAHSTEIIKAFEDEAARH